VKIQFSDLSEQHNEIKKEMNQALKKVIRKGDFILGEDVKLFEQEFAGFFNTGHAVGVSSGTAALFLSLAALGVGPEDEVIVPAFTYIATACAVSYTGAKPVFVDIDEKTYNIDTDALRKAITKRTKVIMPVHLYGQPADMPTIMAIAQENNLAVVEDTAQAHGSSIEMEPGQWRKAGSIGDIGCFSFYPSKNLGALGDGGMVITNNEELYKKVHILRNCGRVSKYDHVVIGYNSRLDTLQAAVLRLKLKRLAAWNAMRQKAALTYNKLLSGVDGAVTPYAAGDVKHVYHVYAVRVKNRDEVFRKLKEAGIDAIIHYPIPLHLQKAYQGLGYKQGDLPVAETVAKEVISLPMFPHIQKTQIKYVVDTLKKLVRG